MCMTASRPTAPQTKTHQRRYAHAHVATLGVDYGVDYGRPRVLFPWDGQSMGYRV